jgi:antitoxin MazE
MKLLVSKWGNSLAVRIPLQSAKTIGVREGDRLIAEVSSDGRLVLAPERNAIGNAQTRRLRRFIQRQKITAPSIDVLRRAERY